MIEAILAVFINNSEIASHCIHRKNSAVLAELLSNPTDFQR